jgi:hypothetical protein
MLFHTDLIVIWHSALHYFIFRYRKYFTGFFVSDQTEFPSISQAFL